MYKAYMKRSVFCISQYIGKCDRGKHILFHKDKNGVNCSPENS